MHITKILAIGFALGIALGGAAHATTKPTCHGKTDHSKPCTDPVNAPNWIFNNSADASAWAAAIGIGVGIGGEGGQGGDGGNASASATGGSVSFKGGSTYIAPAPQASADGWCYTTYVGGVCSPLKSRMIEKRQDLIDRCFDKRGDTMAYKVCISNIDDSFQIKRALRDGGVYGN